MKTALCAILLCLILGCLFVGTANADPRSLPDQVVAAFDKALEDPPIDAQLLYDISFDDRVRIYTAKAPLVVRLIEGSSITFTGENHSDGILVNISITIGQCTTEMDDARLGCDGSADQADCCRSIMQLLNQTPESVFWAAMITTLERPSVRAKPAKTKSAS